MRWWLLCANLGYRHRSGACGWWVDWRVSSFSTAAAAPGGITIVGKVVFNRGEQCGSDDFTLVGALGCGGASGVCNLGGHNSGGACILEGTVGVATLGGGNVSCHSTVGIEIITPVLGTFVVSWGECCPYWCASCCGGLLVPVAVTVIGESCLSSTTCWNMVRNLPRVSRDGSWRCWGILPFNTASIFLAADIIVYVGVIVGVVMYVCLWNTIPDTCWDIVYFIHRFQHL